MNKESIALGQICTRIISGGTPLTSNKDYYDNGTIPWLKTKEINQNRIYNAENYITENGLVNSSAKLIPKNSVIIAMYGDGKTAGRVAINKIPVATNQACCNLIINSDLAHYEFVFYKLMSMYEELVLKKTGSGQQNLNLKIIKDIEINLPPLSQQKAIANILSGLDEKINLNNQTNETLESIAQAIFKSWFIDFDPVRAKIQAKQDGKNPELAAMSVISGKSEDELQKMTAEDFAELQATAALFPDELVESELGEVPRGWELQSLYDTAEFVNGTAFKAKDFSSNTEGLPIIKIAELKQGISAQTKYTNSSFDKKYQVSSGDIFYSWSGSPETSLDVFKWFGGDGWLNQHIFKINTKNKGQTYFVYYLLKYLKPTLIRLATNKQTTGLGHITVANMKQLQVIKPEEHLFLSYAKIIAPIYEKESLLKQESIDLALLRDTLLPKLLSGEVDSTLLKD
ncbi:restriction endonuclease subunit S [Serratia sp. S1B]|nr:restriction endonuclease subunit S [Serratia sp. S1B]